MVIPLTTRVFKSAIERPTDKVYKPLPFSVRRKLLGMRLSVPRMISEMLTSRVDKRPELAPFITVYR